MKNEPIKIFIAYSHKDLDLLEELRMQFAPLEISGKVTVWYDGEIRPGDKWEERIQEELNSAEIILLLVSQYSIFSKYFYESEVQKAIKRDEDGETKVIPVILRPCLWQETPLGKLQALPENGIAIINWAPIDSGYFNVVETLKRIVDDLLWERQFEKHPETASKTSGLLHFTDSEGNRIEYEGEIIRGEANGYGTAKSLYRNSNFVYTGNFVNNLRHDDNAKIIWTSGEEYKGSFQHDKRTGKGKYSWGDGREYIGDFLDNVYTGQAVYKTNTFTYEGEVKGLSFHKKGKLIDYLEKLTYEGEFWEGRKNGKGKISYESGVQYEGEFLDDQPHGKGIRFLPNGVIYEGEFRKGKAYGQGRIFTEKFDIYEGIFTGDWVNAGDVFVDAEGNKLEESVDLMGNKHSKLLFYNGDVFERFINSIGKTENWYYFFDGIKFTRDHGHYSLNIQFSNGSKAQNVGGDIQLGKVFDFYRCKIDRIDIHSMYSVYFWPNGKSMAISDEEYSIDVASGELLDKKGNKVESTVADEKNQAATSKKRWWQILLK